LVHALNYWAATTLATLARRRRRRQRRLRGRERARARLAWVRRISALRARAFRTLVRLLCALRN
jgi:hypothetical protein